MMQLESKKKRETLEQTDGQSGAVQNKQGKSALNVTAHVCTSRQPIVGALVIHIRTHLLLRPSKGFTSGDEISWGHIKASHTPGCTVKKHQRYAGVRFSLSSFGAICM
ncbi:hypothetical protein KUDE01_001351 [Dissostichus eleginoides]|uniref:Uncharacterized protein n=1 Tax=Dissostichus eleginoides TaxID=100907 RepID=A0AAD9CFG4_DISEL|nr:hypothetical protein KUDE01_001351 [Dissostichus eleginoides]